VKTSAGIPFLLPVFAVPPLPIADGLIANG